MFKRKLISCIITTLTLLSTISVQAAPLSEGYSYPIKLCSFPSAAQTSIKNMGYDLHPYTYVNSYYVRRTMNNDSIFYISTHGLVIKYTDGTSTYGGAVAQYNSWGVKTGSVSADIDYDDDTNYSLAGAWGSDSTALKSIKLAYWSACYSARTSSYYGNLIDKSSQLGALCAFGFYPSISTSQSSYFDTKFFAYAAQGTSIYQSAIAAVQATRDKYSGDAGGTDQWRASYRSGIPNYDIRLTPASYGY
jgi:hypothetical protein